jgi:thiamine kinase-like enzyme
MPEFTALKALHKHQLLTEGNFSVPPPLYYFDDIKVLLTERVAGEKLSDIIRKQNRKGAGKGAKAELEDLLFRCGKLLRAVHTIRKTEEKAPLSYYLLERTTGAADYFKEAGSLSAGEYKSFVNAVTKGVENVSGKSFAQVLQHGDYNVGNILVHEGRITVLDFTFSREELIYNDISRLIMSLEIINPYPKNLLFNFSMIPVLREKFLSGYFGKTDDIAQSERLVLELFRARNTILHFMKQHGRCVRKKRKLYLAMVSRIYKKRLREATEEIERLVG